LKAFQTSGLLFWNPFTNECLESVTLKPKCIMDDVRSPAIASKITVAISLHINK
jgi:hypothetical protein